MRSFQLVASLYLLNVAQSQSIPSYSTDGSEREVFQQLTFDLGYGKETFDAILQPNITDYSRGVYDEVKKMNHNGHAVKFINMCKL